MGFKSGFLFICGALLAVAAVFAIAGSSTALDNPQAINMSEYSGELTVSGTGYVYVEPNMAKVTVGVISEADTSTKAMADNADTMDRIMKAVRGLGISERDIKTSTISVQPKYEYQYPDSSASRPPGPVKTKISGYTATNTVAVTVRELSRVGPVIDAAYGAGANEIHGVSFMLTEDRQAEVYREALEQAVAEAKSKAKTIAGAAGIEGIKLKSISESGANFPVYESYAAGAADRAMAAPTPVSPGEQRVSATVSLKYVYVPQ